MKEALLPSSAKADLPLSAYIRDPRLRAAFEQIEREQEYQTPLTENAPSRASAAANCVCVVAGEALRLVVGLFFPASIILVTVAIFGAVS
jgi:hypothetical protein